MSPLMSLNDEIMRLVLGYLIYEKKPQLNFHGGGLIPRMHLDSKYFDSFYRDYAFVIKLREMFRLRCICKRFRHSLDELYPEKLTLFEQRSYYQIIFLKEKAPWFFELSYGGKKACLKLQVSSDPGSIEAVAEALTFPAHFSFHEFFICCVCLPSWLPQLNELLLIQEQAGKQIFCEEIIVDDCGGDHEWSMYDRWKDRDKEVAEFCSIVNRMSAVKTIELQMGPPDHDEDDEDEEEEEEEEDEEEEDDDDNGDDDGDGDDEDDDVEIDDDEEEEEEEEEEDDANVTKCARVD